MKSTIIKQPLGWRLTVYRPTTNSGLRAESQYYLFWEGAVHELNRISARIEREQKAWEKIKKIQHVLLSIKESDLIYKQYKRACRNITKKQYGWLSGILERQGEIK